MLDKFNELFNNADGNDDILSDIGGGLDIRNAGAGFTPTPEAMEEIEDIILSKLKVKEDLEYNHASDATQDEYTISERILTSMAGSSTVDVKKKCRLAGNGNTSTACNQGDIKNFNIKPLNEGVDFNEPIDNQKDGWKSYSIVNNREIIGEMELTKHYRHPNYITLNKILINKDQRKHGYANEALKLLTNYADKARKIIVLTPDNVWGANTNKLKSWYKSNGFVMNTGRYTDFTTTESMYRLPKGAKFGKPLDEDIDASEVQGKDSNIKSINAVVDGKKEVGFVGLDKDQMKYLNSLDIGILPVSQGWFEKAYIIYRNKDKALKLRDFAKSKGGYLKDETPDEARYVGRLLGYKERSIDEYIRRIYKVGIPLDTRKPEDFNDLDEETNNLLGWFGNSKIVDSNGKPLIVFHGQPPKYECNIETKKYDRIEPPKIDAFNNNNPRFLDDEHKGFYFTPNKNVAYKYSEGGNLYDVYLKIENPYIYREDEHVRNPCFLTNEEYEKLISLGYDGIIIENKFKNFYIERGEWGEIIAFYPNQIKSVNNKGSFNSDSNNIVDEEQINEYPEQMDKAYVKTGLYDDNDRNIIMSITKGDPYTKLISDMYKYLTNKYNPEMVKPKPLSGDDYNHLKESHRQLTEYNQNVLPIKDLYAQENNAHPLESFNCLRIREVIINKLRKLPAVAIRNLKEDIRKPRNSYEFNDLNRDLNYIFTCINNLNNHKPETRKKLYTKFFSSGVGSFEELARRLRNNEILYLEHEDAVDDVLEKIEETGSDCELIYNNNNVVVVIIKSAGAMQRLGCGSQWCFTTERGDQYWQDYSRNGAVILVYNFNLDGDEKHRMIVVIGSGDIYDMYNVFDEEGDSYLREIGVSGVVDKAFDRIESGEFVDDEDFYDDDEEEIEEGVGDKYLQNKYNIEPEFADFERKYNETKEDVIYKDDKIVLIKNPKSLTRIGANVRGVIDIEGNLYVEQQSNVIHFRILNILVKLGIINDWDYSWMNKIPTNFITVQRFDKSNEFKIGESNNVLEPDEYRNMFDFTLFKNTDKREDALPVYKKFIDNAKQKNPNIKFNLNRIDKNFDKEEQFEEGVGDKYLQNKYNIEPEFADFERKFNDKKIIDNQEQIVYKDDKLTIIKNPKSLKYIAGKVRGIIDKNGNLYVETKANSTHDDIIKKLVQLGLINDVHNWDLFLPSEFVTVIRYSNTNKFALGEANLSMTPDEDRYENTHPRDEKIYDLFPYMQMMRAIQPFLDKAKQVNPKYEFENDMEQYAFAMHEENIVDKENLTTFAEESNTNQVINEVEIMSLNDLPFKDEVLQMGGNIFSIGGAVRDEFLGKESKDLDILVTGIPMVELEQILSKYGRVDAVGKSFGVLKFKPQGSNEDIDVAIPRTEKPSGEGGHKGFEITSDHDLPIEADMYRRDFTINAIAKDINGNIIDPYNGVEDLKNKIIRVVNPDAFSDDPLRMLRAIQFSARFDFKIEPKTMAMIKDNASRINEIPPERILGEFDKIVQKGDPIKGITAMVVSGIFKAVFGVDFYKVNIPRNKLIMISNMGEFIFALTYKNIDQPAEFFRTNLKGDLDSYKLIKALELSYTAIDSNPTAMRMIAHNMFLTSPQSLSSKLIDDKVVGTCNDLLSGKYPKTVNELAVNGGDLMNLGLKGKEIGDAQKSLLAKIYADKLQNNKEEIFNSLNNETITN